MLNRIRPNSFTETSLSLVENYHAQFQNARGGYWPLEGWWVQRLFWKAVADAIFGLRKTIRSFFTFAVRCCSDRSVDWWSAVHRCPSGDACTKITAATFLLPWDAFVFRKIILFSFIFIIKRYGGGFSINSLHVRRGCVFI